ncbi:RNA-binding S4 domain-containing protein [Actinomyces sp. zg-332]|uniref:RNA-binding S4 domain-containing protein n=1 Tax=Actinomyces sp. zg-332 TaxID=2708340 RepID=UPI001423C7FD|nr:RNA-binding S4 domain-containing protein [Actinomyces sp. zg-332]QPK94437.1 RNA-binding S4 domain-containing protein [Actinomyces sp. zg-332]
MNKIEIFKIKGIIRLGQFLKLTNMAENGIDAKELIQDGFVSVNGVETTQRGLQLKDGDVVCVNVYNQTLCAKVEQISD